MSNISDDFSSIAANMKRPTPPATPDAELLSLGATFEELWNHESLAWIAFDESDEDGDAGPLYKQANELCERIGAICHQIIRIPATTLRGLLVKNRAVCWCIDGRLTAEDLDHVATIGMLGRCLIVNILGDMTSIGAEEPYPDEPEKQPGS